MGAPNSAFSAVGDGIDLDRDGQTVTGRVVRKGSEILTLQAELTEPADISRASLPAMVPSVDLDDRPPGRNTR